MQPVHSEPCSQITGGLPGAVTAWAMRGAAVAWPPVVRLLEGFGLLDVEALTDPESKAFPAYDPRTATPTTSEDEDRR